MREGNPDPDPFDTEEQAVYDPVSGRCALARAGHLLPAVVDARSGAVTCPDAPAGPPLGVDRLPFESVEIALPEGSLIALLTNGLVQTVLEAIRAAPGSDWSLLGRGYFPVPAVPETIADRHRPRNRRNRTAAPGGSCPMSDRSSAWTTPITG